MARPGARGRLLFFGGLLLVLGWWSRPPTVLAVSPEPSPEPEVSENAWNTGVSRGSFRDGGDGGDQPHWQQNGWEASTWEAWTDGAVASPTPSTWTSRWETQRAPSTWTSWTSWTSETTPPSTWTSWTSWISWSSSTWSGTSPTWTSWAVWDKRDGMGGLDIYDFIVAVDFLVVERQYLEW
eukprot:s3477_g5.t1